VAVLSRGGRGPAAELGGLGVTGSNREAADLKRLVEGALARWGRIDAVVNSAGHGPKGPLLQISDEEWHLGLEFYLLNVVKIARLVTPVFQRQGRGSIVNVSSFAAFEPEAAFPTSGVMRAGLASFAKLYADEHAAAGIREQRSARFHRQPAGSPSGARESQQRYGRADEVAELIAFWLLTSYITGLNPHRRRHHASRVAVKRPAGLRFGVALHVAAT
jgi:NAD(P)-dependent dehydrogenase (short-subunit alcohol dehydrogenase family)